MSRTALANIIRKIPIRLNPLIQLIRGNAPGAILMQPEPIRLTSLLLLHIRILCIRQRRLAPGMARPRGEVDAQPRVRDEPVVDFRAVDRVRTKGWARRAGHSAVFTQVWTPGAEQRGDGEGPVWGEDAQGGGGGRGEREECGG